MKAGPAQRSSGISMSRILLDIITGSFTESMMWGGIELSVEGGPDDVDMYIASFQQ